MKRITILLFFAVLACAAVGFGLLSSQQGASADPAPLTVDSVDIGKEDGQGGTACSKPYSAEEVAHSAAGWGIRQENACSGGGWGAPVPDGTARAAWHPSELPSGSGPEASVVLSSGGYKLGTLKIDVLDGQAVSAGDSFEVRVNGTLVYTYTSDSPPETWVTHSIDLVNPANSSRSPILSGSSVTAGTGINPCTTSLTVEIKVTSGAWSLWSTYGQLGVSNFKLQAAEPETMCEADLKKESLSLVGISNGQDIPVSEQVWFQLEEVLHNNGPNPLVPAWSVTLCEPPEGGICSYHVADLEIVTVDGVPLTCDPGNLPPGVVECSQPCVDGVCLASTVIKVEWPHILDVHVNVDLPVSVPEHLYTGWDIHCLEPSTHTWHFENVVEAKDPLIIDPEPGNNAHQLDLTVDCIGTADVKIVDQQLTGTYTYSGGSLTTSNMNPWGGVSALTIPDKFNVDGSGELTLTVYGLDMSQVGYGGGWGWPPSTDDLGAIAVAGMSGSTSVAFDRPNGAWMQLHSAIPEGGGKTWNNLGPYDHDDGYRKYLVQTWHRGLTGGKVFNDGPNNHQYNVEGGGGQSDYETFDLRVVLTPTGNPNEYVMRNYIRMHNSWSWDNGNRTANWGCPWNAAVNDAATGTQDDVLTSGPCVDEVPTETGRFPGAWVKTCDGSPCTAANDHRTMSNLDLSAAYPFIQIGNWGTAQTQLHTISWDSVVVEGLKAEIQVSEDVPITLEKVLHNNGEFGPVDVQVATVLDRVNIGYDGAADPCNAAYSADEAAHLASGWGPSVERACTHGNYGGGSDDGNSRLVWHWNEPLGGDDSERGASVILNSDSLKPHTLRLNVLDGMAGVLIPDDSFEVWVNGTLVYTYLGSNPVTAETWVVHNIDLFNPVASSRAPVIAGSNIIPGSAIAPTNTLLVEIKSIGQKWQWFNPYGQLAVSWIELLANSPTQVSLPVGEDVPVEEPLVIHCWEPSTHTLTITNEILTVEGVHMVDLNLANNSMSSDLTVDCVTQTDVKILSQQLLNPPSSIPVSQNVPVTLRKVLHNNGPFGPVDVSVDADAKIVPADCTATPDPGNPTSATVPMGTDTVVDEVWSIHCDSPSSHTFTFTDAIAITTAHITDFEPNNNSASANLTVAAIGTADVKIVDQWVDAPAEVAVSENVPVTVYKLLHNNGPDAAAEIELGTVIDSVNIGGRDTGNQSDPACNAGYSDDEAAHSADGWGAEIVPECHGAYGGGSDDGNSRVAWHLNELPSSANDTREASVTLTNPGFQLGILRTSVLDGQAGSNSFELRVNGTLVYTYHSDPSAAEFWVIHSVDLVNPANSSFDVGGGSFSAGTGINAFTDSLEIEFTVLGDKWSGFDTWGQLAVSWVELLAGSTIQVPLDVSVDVPVEEHLVIHCSEPSTHVFEFENKILRIKDEHVVDPNPGNNSVPGQITVDCIAQADVKITSQALVSPPASIDVSATVPVTLRKHLHNNGPYGPVTVSISPSATAPTDCTATPAQGNPTSAILPVSTDVVVDEVWNIHCAKASSHTFTFNDVIAITDPPHVVDSNQGNNGPKATSLTVTAIGYSDVKVVSVSVTGPPEIDVSQNQSITVKTTLHNNGLYGPVQVGLSYGGTAPPDCSVATVDPPQKSLPVSVDVVDNHTWTIHCAKPSSHTFSFTTTITGVKDPHVVELNPGNNSGSGTFTVKAIGYSDLKVAAQYMADPPAQIPVSQDVTVVLDKVIHNNGPWGPVDASTTTTVHVPANCTVRPEVHTQQFSDVPVSVDILHHEPFVVHCYQLGEYTFTFDDTVAVKEPHVRDLVSSNNSWLGTELTVEATGLADIKITSATLVDPPTKIPLGENVDVTLRKHIHNNGPWTPVNIAITSSASAPTHCTIVPKSVPTSISGVPMSVDQVVDEVWTVRCTQNTTLKTFVFNNSISVTSTHVYDPDGANNAVVKYLTVTDDPADPLGDMDGDGWTNGAEAVIGTDPADACPDGLFDDAWPPDLNNDTWVDILDVVRYKPIIGGLYDSRYDLNVDESVDVMDVLMYKPVLGSFCTP